MLYQVYVTDSLKYLLGNNVRFADLIKDGDTETRSADEIKDSIKDKLRRLGNGHIQSGSEANPG